jgi:serine/threonine-protein kinase
MDIGRFQQIEQIFHSALERAAAGEGASSLSLAETPAGDMVGRKLSHYEVVEKLGEGGMGVVYKARDLRLDRFVAIKILPGDKAADPDSRKRFMREARAASALNHPHIVTIYDIASEGGTDLIVMEHVDGCSLKALIPDRGLPLNKAVEYATQMASALDTAHKAGIIHRDLKPTNVMVNSAARVKILDFGLAKQTGGEQAEGTSSLTQTGAVIGTVTYMAPEQATGSAMDHRADVFSFGVTLYEMLAGSVPFRGPNTMAVLHAIVLRRSAAVAGCAAGSACRARRTGAARAGKIPGPAGGDHAGGGVRAAADRARVGRGAAGRADGGDGANQGPGAARS